MFCISLIVLVGVSMFNDCYGKPNLFLREMNEVGSAVNGTGAGCQCQNYACGCCVHLEVPKIRLNDTACTNMSYLPQEYGISITVTLDKWTIFNATISARSPPPMCFGGGFLEEYADICLKFYDLNVTSSSMHGCADLIVRFKKMTIAKYHLGCFTLGKKKLDFLFDERMLNKTSEVKSLHIPKVFLIK